MKMQNIKNPYCEKEMVPVMAHNYINRCWLTFDYVLLVFVYVIKELPINFPLTSCNIFNFLPL